MIAIIFLGLLAGCSAAPHYHHHPHHHERSYVNSDWNPFLNDNVPIFNTREFLSDLNKEMREMSDELNKMAKELNKNNFPAITSQRGIQGNEYHVTIPLSGFKENEVVVKVSKGVLMIQAVHKTEGGADNSYLNINTLPDCVNGSGTWTLENGVLKILFPLKDNANVPQVTEAPATESPEPEPITEVMNHNREEMDSHAVTEDTTADADAGISGDLGKGREIQTNEIPRSSVEATTYAVDFKDEVEFVPVRY